MHEKSAFAVTGHPFDYWLHRSAFPSSASTHFSPVIHIRHVNSYYHKQPAFSPEFQLEALFSSQKFNHGELIKAHWQILNEGITKNSITTFSHSNFLPTKTKEQMLKNMSDPRAYQHCHLLVVYNIWGTAFHSTLI